MFLLDREVLQGRPLAGIALVLTMFLKLRLAGNGAHVDHVRTYRASGRSNFGWTLRSPRFRATSLWSLVAVSKCSLGFGAAPSWS